MAVMWMLEDSAEEVMRERRTFRAYVEALAQLLRWEAANTPASWPTSTTPPTIAQWLDEAGLH